MEEISKNQIIDSSTWYAQGGIAAVLAKEDSTKSHIEDTLKVGDGLCNREAVEFCIENGREAISWLEDCGVVFTKNKKNSDLHLTQEGGHSFRRVVHADDATGREVSDSLAAKVLRNKNIKILENHLKIQPFLLGSTPSSCDFAVYGQLTQLIGFDPTPRRIAHEIAPRVIGWVSSLEDRSGLEDKEHNLKLSDLPQTIHDLFKELSISYIPTMIENHRAISNGEKEWKVDLDGYQWKQKSFPYQAKCLDWIRAEYQNLASDHKEDIFNFLKDNNCESLVEKV